MSQFYVRYLYVSNLNIKLSSATWTNAVKVRVAVAYNKNASFSFHTVVKKLSCKVELFRNYFTFTNLIALLFEMCHMSLHKLLPCDCFITAQYSDDVCNARIAMNFCGFGPSFLQAFYDYMWKLRKF